jgi:hypothetical protein
MLVKACVVRKHLLIASRSSDSESGSLERERHQCCLASDPLHNFPVARVKSTGTLFYTWVHAAAPRWVKNLLQSAKNCGESCWPSR